MGFDKEFLQRQLELSRKCMEQIKRDQDNLNLILEGTLKGDIPESDKKEISKVKGLMQKAITLAKDGKLEEAGNLIKEFRNGRKSN